MGVPIIRAPVFGFCTGAPGRSKLPDGARDTMGPGESPNLAQKNRGFQNAIHFRFKKQRSKVKGDLLPVGIPEEINCDASKRQATGNS